MIRILVDSASDYQMQELKEKHIELVPLSVNIGENAYIDGVNLERDQFYEILQETGEFPKTSQPSPQAFLSVFEDAKEKGDDLICILLSSALSGTYQSAVLAKNMVEYDRIYLIDTLSATYNIKVMADYACRLVEKGMPAKEIVAELEGFKSRVKVVAALDTLEYLARGGRISKSVAALGNLAGIKPVITVNAEGEVAVLGKCLGKNKAVNHMVKTLQETGVDQSFPMYTIYSYGTENCSRFQNKLEKEGYTIAERLQIGPVIGAHIGPEAFGVVFVCK